MKPLFGGFFAMAMHRADGAIRSSAVSPDGGVLRRWGNPRVTFMKPLFGGFFAYGDDASCRNEVFVMRLFCVGFCKIGK